MTAELRTPEDQSIFSARGFRRIGNEIALDASVRREVEAKFSKIEQYTEEGYTQFIMWSFINGRKRRVFVQTYEAEFYDGLESIALWPENSDGQLAKNLLFIERRFKDDEKTEIDGEIPLKTYILTPSKKYQLPSNHWDLSQDDHDKIEEIAEECTRNEFKKYKTLSPTAANRFIGEFETDTAASIYG